MPLAAAETVIPCPKPKCRVPAGMRCVTPAGNKTAIHAARRDAYKKWAQDNLYREAKDDLPHATAVLDDDQKTAAVLDKVYAQAVSVSDLAQMLRFSKKLMDDMGQDFYLGLANMMLEQGFKLPS